MKRIMAILLVCGMMISCVACGDAEDSNKEITSVEKEQDKDDKSEDDEKEKDDKNEDSKSEEEESAKDDESAEDDEPAEDDSSEEEENAALPELEEQVLWEFDDIKVTATGISEDSFWGAGIDILIENNSDKDISISTDAVIVNGFMIDDLSYFEVTAGNKVNDSITLLSSDLEAAGIDNIGEIELYMYASDSETYDRVAESGCITISTSDAANADTQADVDGVTLYDENGIKIVGQYVDENSFWGAAILLYIENNTDKNLTIHGEDIAINGYMITAFCYQDVYAGKKAVTDITLFSSDLEENGITSIDDVQVTFRATDEDYNEVANSGKVNFSTN